MKEEGERERGFKVQDRRRFAADGEAREESTEQASAPADSPSAPVTDEPAADPPPFSTAEPTQITFAAFLISLSAQALAHLGEIPDPVDRTSRVDLESARQIIDILGVLGEKTRGNLDADESALLDNALYDLRMKYVERSRNR